MPWRANENQFLTHIQAITPFRCQAWLLYVIFMVGDMLESRFKWLPGSHLQQYYINQAKLLELNLSS